MKKTNIIFLILFLSHCYCIHSTKPIESVKSQTTMRKNFKNTPIKNNEGNICELCKKLFQRPSSLNKHIREYHEPPSPFKCLQCNNHFISQKNLNRHVKNYHRQKILNKCIKTISTNKIKTSPVNQPKISMIQSMVYPTLLYTQQQITPSIIFPQVNTQNFIPSLQPSFKEESLFDLNDNNQDLLFFNESL